MASSMPNKHTSEGASRRCHVGVSDGPLSTPASHRPVQSPLLPPPPVRVVGLSSGSADIDAALREWYGTEGTNLAVVMGEYGAGKSTALRRFLAYLIGSNRR